MSQRFKLYRSDLDSLEWLAVNALQGDVSADIPEHLSHIRRACRRLVALRESHDRLMAACALAREQLDQCDCSNGVTSPMGDVDEGNVIAGRTDDQLAAAIFAGTPS